MTAKYKIEEYSSTKNIFLKKFMLAVILLAVILIILLIIYIFVPHTVIVNGYSMVPVMNIGDKVDVVSKWGYLLNNELKRGDIVVIKTPIEATEKVNKYKELLIQNSINEYYSIKRVVGIPGDKLAIRDGILYVNGIHVQHNCMDLLNVNESTLLGYYVLGDNPTMSIDSRTYGEIDGSSIVYIVKDQEKYKVKLGGFEAIGR